MTFSLALIVLLVIALLVISREPLPAGSFVTSQA